MMLIKEKLKTRVKPINTINENFSEQLLKKNKGVGQYPISGSNIVYKLENKDEQNFVELIVNLLIQIRNFNYKQLLSVSSQSNFKQDLIGQLKSLLAGINSKKTDFSEEINVLTKNITNNSFFNNTEKLDLLIKNIENKQKKK